MRIIASESSNLKFGVEWAQNVFLNPWMLAAVGLEITSFFAWIKILSINNLSIAFPLSSVSYILILAVGRLVFHEVILPTQIIGSFLIIAGCWLVGTASNKGGKPA